jgi:NADH-quinone oxidoreductase subunit M
LLQTGVIGTFTALNFFHWFLFWELSLIPAFFLVKFYGGLRRDEAALNFFIQTMVGSIAMLLGFAALYLQTGSFDFYDLAALGVQNGSSGTPLLLISFVGIFLGLAVKVPIFGLHTWLPVTYSEAPSAVTMVLTGVMSKMGVYGFLRILLPVFPGYLNCSILFWLAIATILFSAFAALAQTDLKRILAYSSMNHLGYCLLAIFAAAKAGDADAINKAAAVNGTILQMASHGLIASALFFSVALIERRSGGARDLRGFGGLRALAPVFSGLMGIALFASLGLPGLSGFVAEFLMFKGVFALVPWAAFLAAPALLLTAIFTLRLFQGIFYGPIAPGNTGWKDLNGGEKFALIPVIALIFLLGIYPQLLIQFINPTTTALTAVLK